MWGLLLSTIVTSAADSVNPIAITQQFILQGMVKKPKDIWYFIIPTGVANLIGGFLAYFGLVTIIGDFFAKTADKHGQILFTAELTLGGAFLLGCGYLLFSSKSKAAQDKSHSETDSIDAASDESEAAKKIKSISPLALVMLGIGATISELITALPYFAFLAILFTYQLTLPQVTFILLVYNTIYTSPLMLLYFIYVKAQDKFDHLYLMIKSKVSKWSRILAPTIVGIIGILLVYHASTILFR